MKKLTGLYLNTSKKDGTKYMSGKSQEGIKYFIFKNKKEKDTHPDYNLYVEDDTPPEPVVKQDIVVEDEEVPF